MTSLELPAITLDEVKARLATKVYPRVTEETILEKISDVSYIQLDAGDDPLIPSGTLCIITMKSGWITTGFSAPADPRNYDQDVGKRYAYDNAFKPLWQLEGYLLKEHLYRQQQSIDEGFPPPPSTPPIPTPPAPLPEDV